MSRVLKPVVALAVMAVICAGLSGCRSKDVREPEQLKQYVVKAFVEDEQGTRSELDGQGQKEPVRIEGLGTYASGKTAKLTVWVEEPSEIEVSAVLFEYKADYSPKVLPRTGPEFESRTVITDKDHPNRLLFSFALLGDVTCVVKTQRKPAPEKPEPTPEPDPGVEPEPEPLPYAKNVLVNEQYWKEQNKKAWAMVYPHIAKEDYDLTKRWMKNAWPNMRNMVKTDTIYTEEPTIMAWSFYPGYLANEKEVQSNKILFRVAYALADRSGNIVEIYPPGYWDTCPGAIQGTVVFPTVPEGEYEEHVLVNIVGEKEWYDLPILEDHWISNTPYTEDPNKRVETYYHKLFRSGAKVYKRGDVMDQRDLWTSDKIRTRTVVKRNSEQALPIPRWSKPKMYSTTTPSPQTRLIYLETGLATFYYDLQTKSIELELTNGCNQEIKGEIVCVMRQKHWHDQNLDAIDYAQRKLKEVAAELFGTNTSKFRGGGYDTVNLEEWEVEIGRTSVTINPSVDGQSVVIPCDGSRTKGKPYPNLTTNLDSRDFTFYWIPEGSSERFFMMQANHKALNLQEKSSVPWDGWFIGSYTHPSMGHTNQIVLQKELYDGTRELGNRVKCGSMY